MENEQQNRETEVRHTHYPLHRLRSHVVKAMLCVSWARIEAARRRVYRFSSPRVQGTSACAPGYAGHRKLTNAIGGQPVMAGLAHAHGVVAPKRKGNVEMKRSQLEEHSKMAAARGSGSRQSGTTDKLRPLLQHQHAPGCSQGGPAALPEAVHNGAEGAARCVAYHLDH